MLEEITYIRKKFIMETLGISLVQFGTGPYQEFGSIHEHPSFIVSTFSDVLLQITIAFNVSGKLKCYDIKLSPVYFEEYVKEIMVPTVKAIYELYRHKLTHLELDKMIFVYNKKFEILNETTKIPIELKIR